MGETSAESSRGGIGGRFEQILRMPLGIILMALAYTGFFPSPLHILFGVVGFLLFCSGVLGTLSTYGIDITKPKKK